MLLIFSSQFIQNKTYLIVLLVIFYVFFYFNNVLVDALIVDQSLKDINDGAREV
jgi:hypothetical protein